MQIAFVHRIRGHWRGNIFGALGLFLAASGVACSNPGYRTEVYPGQQGQYTVQRVPETTAAPVQNQPVESSTPTAASSGAPANVATPAATPAAATAPVDENLSQVETMWPKLSDSDKALLAATAKRLAGGR